MLQVTDLFLNEQRELENGGRLNASSSSNSDNNSGNTRSNGTNSSSRGLRGCFQSRDVSENNNNNMSSISMRVSEKPLGAITMTKGLAVFYFALYRDIYWKCLRVGCRFR